MYRYTFLNNFYKIFIKDILRFICAIEMKEDN